MREFFFVILMGLSACSMETPIAQSVLTEVERADAGSGSMCLDAEQRCDPDREDACCAGLSCVLTAQSNTIPPAELYQCKATGARLCAAEDEACDPEVADGCCAGLSCVLTAQSNSIPPAELYQCKGENGGCLAEGESCSARAPCCDELSCTVVGQTNSVPPQPISQCTMTASR